MKSKRVCIKLVVVLLLILFSGCGYHESRSLHEAGPAQPQDIRGLTEQEEIVAEIQSGLIAKLVARLDQGLNLDLRLSKGKTPIMEAAVWRQHEIVKLLVSRGANLIILDEDGKSVRDHASGSTEILRLLPASIDPATIERLFLLVDASDYRKLKSELDLGIDPNLRNADGDTLLIRAVRIGSRAVVATLVRYPGIGLSERDSTGKTALFIARELRNLQIEKELLARGATE